MQIKYFCSLWGMTHSTLEANIRAIKAAGFDGVEIAWLRDVRQGDDLRKVRELLDMLGLETIFLAHSRNGVPIEHGKEMIAQMKLAAELRPILINSQSGRDFFPLKESIRLIKQLNKVAAQLGLSIVHEVHRSKSLYTLPTTIAVLDAIPDLRLNADLSHFCVVHESYLQDQLESLHRVLDRCHYIHARVGHPEGPQVPDPRAPEWQQAVDYHIGWWQRIVDARKAEGATEMAICTEFGTPTYMPILPYTRQPVANLWEINLWMRDTLKARLTT